MTIIRYAVLGGALGGAFLLASPPSVPATLTLTGPTSCVAGDSVSYAATAKDTRGKVVPKPDLAWSSTEATIAGVISISKTRRQATYRCGSGGTTMITVSWSIQSPALMASEWLTVTGPPPANTPPIAAFTWSCDNLGLCQFNGTGSSDAESSITYQWAIGLTSPEPTTATTTGQYTTTGTKTVSLTVTDVGALADTVTHSFPVTITTPPPAPVATVAVAPSTATIVVGGTQQFTATLRDASNNVLTGRVVTWGSSNTSHATVSSSGLATGVGAGTPTITATSEGQQGTAALTVNAASCTLLKDFVPHAQPALTKPGYLQTVIDPVFNTPITRITGNVGSPIPVVGGTWGTVTRQNYSKDPAWSADGGMIVLKYTSGATAGHLFLDGNTYTPIVARNAPGPEYRWHPTKPDTMIYVASNGSVGYWNPRTNASGVRYAASGYSSALFGRYEGNPSNDGRYVVVYATRNADSKLVAYAVDLTTATKFADIDFVAHGLTDVDLVSVSALGGYVAVLATVNGSLANIKVFTKTATVVTTWTDMRVGHFDMGVDQAGNEVMFTGPGSGTYAKRFIMRRFSDGVITPITAAITYNHHVSTRNNLRLGWAYAVVNDRLGSPLDGEMFGLKLDGTGSIERYGHHRSNVVDYDANPFAVPSPDGKRVMFASNWGDPSGRPVQTYVVDFRGCQ